MIDSKYYFLKEFDQNSNSIFNPLLEAKDLSDFRIFLNGEEISSEGISIVNDSLEVNKEFRNGDIFEIVKILPYLQPYQISNKYPFNTEIIYYLAALLRLFTEDLFGGKQISLTGQIPVSENLDDLILDSNFLIRINDFMKDKQFISGFLFDYSFSRAKNYLYLDRKILLPFIDVAIQKGNYTEDLSVPSQGILKFIITKTPQFFSSTYANNPFVYSDPIKVGDNYIYIAFDVYRSAKLKISDKKRLYYVRFSDLLNHKNYSNVFENGYHFQGDFEFRTYSFRSASKIKVKVPISSINSREFIQKYKINDVDTDVDISGPYITISERNDGPYPSFRTFSISKDIDFNFKYFTLLIEESYFNNNKLIKDPFLGEFIENNSNNVLPEKVNFPVGTGYPLCVFEFDISEDLRSIIPRIFGLHIGGFKYGSNSTFNLISLQNGNKSFQRSFASFNSFITPEISGLWQGKVQYTNNLSLENKYLDLIFNIDGSSGSLGRAFFRNPNTIQRIPNEDLTGLISEDTILEKYEIRESINDSDILNILPANSRLLPEDGKVKVLLFSPSLMNINNEDFWLKLLPSFDSSLNLDVIDNVDDLETKSYEAFFLSFNDLENNLRTSKVIYNSLRCCLVSNSILYEDRLELDFFKNNILVSNLELHFSNGQFIEINSQSNKIIYVNNKIIIPLSVNLLNINNLSVKGIIIYD